MIWSVASPRLNCRRSACERSTATCLNDWISSPARCRFATSCSAASREVRTNSSSCERRSGSDPQLGLEHFGAAREARRHRQADADRVVDLMGDAGDQAAERRQPFGVDQVLLRGVEFEQRALGLFLRGAQFVLGLALGDGVFAEHFHRARHRADLVPGGRCPAPRGRNRPR